MFINLNNNLQIKILNYNNNNINHKPIQDSYK